MKRNARLAGLALAILSALAFLVAGAPLPTAPEPPDPAVTGAAVAEAVAGQGVELPEGFDLAALGERVAAAMPASRNVGTASALGKNIAEFVTEAGGTVPEGVADAQLGDVAIGVTGQLRAALAGEAEWGPTLWAIGGLLSGLLMAWFGWEPKTKVTTLSCVLGLGLVLGGCGSVRVTTGGPDWHATLDLAVRGAVNAAVYDLGEDQRQVIEDTAWICAPLAHTAIEQAMSGTVVLDPLIAEFGTCLSASLAEVKVGQIVVDLAVPAVRAVVYQVARAAGLPEG